jgi:hypothetical protein
MYQSRHVISSGGASSAPDCAALQGRPVKGSFTVADAMAHAPPWTVPPFQAVSGSYRMRHLYASARQPEGSRRHARSARTSHDPSARRQPAGQHITSDLGHQDGPPVATDAPRASTCPLRTRSAGQRRELAVTPDSPVHRLTHLHLAISQDDKRSSRLLPVARSGWSAASSATICPIPKLIVQVSIPATRSTQRLFGRAWMPTTSTRPSVPLKSSGLAV